MRRKILRSSPIEEFDEEVYSHVCEDKFDGRNEEKAVENSKSKPHMESIIRINPIEEKAIEKFNGEHPSSARENDAEIHFKRKKISDPIREIGQSSQLGR